MLDKGQEQRPHRRVLRMEETDAELQRFESALVETRRELRDIRETVSKRLGARDAQIFDAHLLVLEDPVLIDQVTNMVREDRVNAEFAFHEVITQYTHALSEVQDDYLRERAADIQDVSDRVLEQLTGRSHAIDLKHLDGPCIIISHDLKPGHTAQLDREKVLGFATDVGGKTSHTAIMAGSLRIPAVVGLRNACRELTTGAHALLDGLNGLVIVNPTDQTLFEYGQLTRKQEDLQARLEEIKDSPAVTLDGQRITLSANVEQISDTAAVLDCGAEGVGLFRTEYLFLDRETAPTEEEQYLSYQKVATALAPQPVIFRTLDIGADKLAGSWSGTRETNPFLGWRAIRFCLQETAIFKAQLRAILRASAETNVKLLYPMISGVDELIEANKLLDECKVELRTENLPFDEEIEVGIMIEIPSAVMIADSLAQRANFFSIGTNDLIQYTLAVDRLNEKIAHLYEPTHPGILRLIKATVDAGQAHGIWTGVCGEMAGDVAAVPLLLGLGVTELSVTPSMVPRVKMLIRSIEMSQMRELAEFALKSDSPKEILARAEALAKAAVPSFFEG